MYPRLQLIDEFIRQGLRAPRMVRLHDAGLGHRHLPWTLQSTSLPSHPLLHQSNYSLLINQSTLITKPELSIDDSTRELANYCSRDPVDEFLLPITILRSPIIYL